MATRYKYLGKRVKDIRPKGLTHVKEVKAILRAIKKDVRAGRISKKVAKGRLLLLYRLTFKKNNSKLKASLRTRVRLRRMIKNAMSNIKGKK